MFEKKVGRPSNDTIKKRRIFKFSVVAIILAVIGVVAGVTYARYLSNTESKADLDVAKWNMSWSADGTANGMANLTITPVSNDYVTNGKIAPGSRFEGTYVINPGDTEVAVESSFWIFESDSLNFSFGTFNQKGTVRIVSASYTIDGVETNLTIKNEEKSEIVCTDLDPNNIMSGSNYTQTGVCSQENTTYADFTYYYPETPIIIPLSKIKEGKGLTTVKVVFEVDGNFSAEQVSNDSWNIISLNLNAIQHLGDNKLLNIDTIAPLTGVHGSQRRYAKNKVAN